MKDNPMLEFIDDIVDRREYINMIAFPARHINDDHHLFHHTHAESICATINVKAIPSRNDQSFFRLYKRLSLISVVNLLACISTF